MVNATLIVFIIITVVLLFTAMVLSAMASNDASKGGSDCKEGCHKYSMWSALVTGLAVAAIVIVLIIYIVSSRKQLAAVAQKHVSNIHGALGGYTGNQNASFGAGNNFSYSSPGQEMMNMSS